MKTARGSRARLMAGAAVALAALGAGVLAPAQPALGATFVPIAGAGSSWAYPAIQAWSSDVAQFGIPINYTPVGSTAGRVNFTDGTVDFAASEIPYGLMDGNNFDPPPTRGYAYMPDLAGGTALMYNLTIGTTQVTNLRLSGAVIAGIFTNQITAWNDPRIAADNPGLTLPAIPVTPVVRSDHDGTTWYFTQWMNATQNSSWTAYCAETGRTPCTATSTYPVESGTAMVNVPGDSGVSNYVSQSSANGAIGYVAYASALEAGFPVAKVLNAAGYYTAPTAGNVGVSLLSAQLNTDPNSVLYLTEDLSQVYTDTDPRTYELSSYSYMILPTDLTSGMTTDKGNSLGAFGQFALCVGQSQVDVLGYSALPINLVEAGFAQLQKIPGANVPATTAAFIAGCHNPTFSTDGTNTLATSDPMPPACDQQGPAQCAATGVTGVGTAITLSASPNPVVAGQFVTLTATTSAANGLPPGGTVQFEVGGTAIGPPVAVDTSGVGSTGVAVMTTSFAAAGQYTLTAVFTPTAGFTGSSAALTLTVIPSEPSNVPLAVNVPQIGSFSLTVDTASTVNLTVSGNNAAAAMNPVVVSDTRNSFPGWSVTGQDGTWIGSGTARGATMSGDQLGWTPTSSTAPLTQGVTLGQVVTPASPGLGSSPAVLASAFAGVGNGYGSTTLGADLTLLIPPPQAAGDYTGALTITAVTSNP
jgi:ABC-type phosphate transport system substrate-binding protein